MITLKLLLLLHTSWYAEKKLHHAMFHTKLMDSKTLLLEEQLVVAGNCRALTYLFRKLLPDQGHDERSLPHLGCSE